MARLARSGASNCVGPRKITPSSEPSMPKPAPLSLLKISTGLREVGYFREPAVPSRSWWRFSLPFIDLGFSFSQPRRARTQGCRSSASVDGSTPTTPPPTSTFTSRSASVGVTLPDLAAGHRRNGTGQARNRDRVASQGLPALLALSITASGTTQNQCRNP